MELYDELHDLVQRYGELCFTLGSINNYVQTGASITETIIIRQQIKGITDVANLIREAIKTYGEYTPNEQDVYEKLLDLPPYID
jgi:hypothetical protein